MTSNTTRSHSVRMSAIFTIAFLLFGAFQIADVDAQAPKLAGKQRRELPKKKKISTTVTPPTAANNSELDQQSPATEEIDEAVETSPRRGGVSLTAKNAIRLNYGRGDWNRSATQVDAAVIFLREGTTGRIVQIEVEETAPDSATFSGTYSINWRNLDDLRVEIFAPPQNLLNDISGRRKITQMIESKELRRLPFVLRKDPVTGVQNVELFDNSDQARLAYRAFQAEQELLVALKNKLDKRNQTLDTAMLAIEKAEFEESSKNMAERVRLSQLETQRLSGLLQKFTALTPEERAKRRTDAQAAADQAMLDYRANRFTEARKAFETAVELDPTNRSYYFQYGVTLYKLDDFNRSLVYLDLAEGKDVNTVERDFYRGLAFYRLKDTNASLDAFTKVVDAKDPNISPSANFYRGIIHFEKKRWDDSRKEFQAVLDSSSDPALDERSEQYIESALRMQQMEAERSRRWWLNGTFGLMYDDNVLLSSDSDRDRGVATDTAALRSLLVGSAKYRAIYEDTNELAIQLDALTMYSVDKSFQTVQAISNSDATIIGLTVPWTHKGLFLGKGHKLDVIPGYETTYMSIENNEMKSIFNSYLLGFQNLFVVRETWFTNLNVDIRKDNSTLSSSTSDDDASALKTKLTWSNINFAFEDKKQILLSDLSYTLNNAQGKNAVFNRVDVGVGYVRPAWWEMTFNTKLSAYALNYPENTNGRADSSLNLLAGFSRKVSDKLNAGFSATYTINNSNVSAYQYKKLVTLFSISANEVF